MKNHLFYLLDLVFVILATFAFLYSAVELSVSRNCDDTVIHAAPNCDYQKGNDALLMIGSLAAVVAFVLGFCMALGFLVAFAALGVSAAMTIIWMIAFASSDNYDALNSDAQNQAYAEQLLLLGVETTLLVLSMVLFCERKSMLGGLCCKK